MKQTNNMKQMHTEVYLGELERNQIIAERKLDKLHKENEQLYSNSIWLSVMGAVVIGAAAIAMYVCGI